MNRGESVPTSSVDLMDQDDDPRADGLLDRVRLVEDQPLADRATAFAQLHDELRTRLESGGGA
jgi:hypothetical protein